MNFQGPVLGIDLGAFTSLVAVVQDGAVKVLDSNMGYVTPSCVFVRDVMHLEAELRTITDPHRTVRNIKRILGRTYADVIADPSRPLGPVRVEADPETGNTLVAVDEHRLPPEVVAATILVELKKAAEAHLGRSVSKAVISVPTYFNAAQRHAVRDAGILAGLKVLQLVNEPTAAAMAYAYGREFNKTIVVVDVGGGGSSISVVRVDHDKISVLASSGQRLPGGEDFDNLMVEHVKQIIKAEHKKDLTDVSHIESLRCQLRAGKEILSCSNFATINACFLRELGVYFEMEIKPEDFQSVCEVSLNHIAHTILSTVKASKVDAIDDVILIGGSTCIPCLRSLIQTELGRMIGKAVNPDEAVAKGAALLGAGCMTLSREISTASTSVSMGSFKFEIPLQFPLPYQKEVQLSNDVKITQNDKTVIIWNKPKDVIFIKICNYHGTMQFKGLQGQQMFVRPLGCLTKHKRKVWQSRMIGLISRR